MVLLVASLFNDIALKHYLLFLSSRRQTCDKPVSQIGFVQTFGTVLLAMSSISMKQIVYMYISVYVYMHKVFLKQNLVRNDCVIR